MNLKPKDANPIHPGWTIVAIIVTLVTLLTGPSLWRHANEPTGEPSDPAPIDLSDVRVRPKHADDLGGILIGRDGYGKPTEGARTVAVYMDFLCPGCGEVSRGLDPTLIQLMREGRIDLDLHFLSFGDMASWGTKDKYSTRAARLILQVSDKDPDSAHLLTLMERLYAKDFQPSEGAGYQTVTDRQLREQAARAGVDERLLDGDGDEYDQWLDAVNRLTLRRKELWAPGQDGFSSPTITIDGEYWNLTTAGNDLAKALEKKLAEQ